MSVAAAAVKAGVTFTEVQFALLGLQEAQKDIKMSVIQQKMLFKERFFFKFLMVFLCSILFLSY